LAWAVCALTGRVVSMLGCSLEPYAPEVAIARGGSAGHEQAVEWIREHSPSDPEDQRARALQEPYSVRCVPQIVGAVLDFLGATGSILVTEALGTSDNPVVVDGSIFHAGNFHAISSGLASDLMSSLVHQLAFVAERQLSLLLDPATNGGRNPFLAPDPGATSGLAGVQLAATAMLAEIRQLCLPSTTTALATNLGNQDVVPMSLNGAIKVRGQIELANLIVASHALVVTHYGFDASIQATSKLWASLADATAPLTIDRPLAADVRLIRDLLLEASTRPCASMGADLGFG
jgi:histidine ammonia-lyase